MRAKDIDTWVTARHGLCQIGRLQKEQVQGGLNKRKAGKILLIKSSCRGIILVPGEMERLHHGTLESVQDF